jgi:hypothetical protein
MINNLDYLIHCESCDTVEGPMFERDDGYGPICEDCNRPRALGTLEHFLAWRKRILDKWSNPDDTPESLAFNRARDKAYNSVRKVSEDREIRVSLFDTECLLEILRAARVVLNDMAVEANDLNLANPTVIYEGKDLIAALDGLIDSYSEAIDRARSADVTTDADVH